MGIYQKVITHHSVSTEAEVSVSFRSLLTRLTETELRAQGVDGIVMLSTITNEPTYTSGRVSGSEESTFAICVKNHPNERVDYHSLKHPDLSTGSYGHD